MPGQYQINAPTVIAIDLGTGSVRALLVDSGLNVLARHSVPLTIDEHAQGWAQQEPQMVVDATVEAIRALSRSYPDLLPTVAGLCFSNAVSSLLPVDRHGLPLYPALIWADTRSAREADWLKAEHGLELYRRTGCPVHATYWPAKLRWFQNHASETFRKAAKWMALKDYVLYALTGEQVMDVSNAAATGLLNLEDKSWDGLALHLAGIEAGFLPVIYPTTTIVPGLKPALASELGLTAGLPIILGAGDGVLSSLGAGAVHRGQATTMIGSSGACRTVSAGPGSRDPLCRTWSYPLLDDLWILGGAENSGGMVVDWLLQTVYGIPPGSEELQTLLKDAANASPGADGLVFLPYLFGERAPIWNADARGVFVGLSAQHNRTHLARAVLEGTVYALFTVFEALDEQAGPITEVRVSGGFVRSPVWLQIQADLFARRLAVPENFEGSAMGAAILGHYALGNLDDLASAVKSIPVSVQVEPDPAAVEIYQNLIPIYNKVYANLSDVFPALRSIREST